jgi:hypothetical protein
MNEFYMLYICYSKPHMFLLEFVVLSVSMHESYFVDFNYFLVDRLGIGELRLM